jgi:hypothetical protein
VLPGRSLGLRFRGQSLWCDGLGGGECQREPYGCGTVFEISPAGGGVWSVSWIYSFKSFGTGASPKRRTDLRLLWKSLRNHSTGRLVGLGNRVRTDPIDPICRQLEVRSFSPRPLGSCEKIDQQLCRPAVRKGSAFPTTAPKPLFPLTRNFRSQLSSVG